MSEANAAPAAAAASTPAPAAAPVDELDEILKNVQNFREEAPAQRPAPAATPTPAPAATPAPAGTPAPAAQNAPIERTGDPRVDEMLRREANRDMNHAITSMKTAQPALAKVDPEIIEAYMNSRAIKDVRIHTAWIQRHQHPDRFNQVVEALGRSFAKTLPAVDTGQATAERRAAGDLSRATAPAATRTQKDNEALSLSDAEFNRKWSKGSF